VGARDPTRFEVEGVSYRLLHLAVKRSTKDEFSGAVFFRSSAAPSCEACAKLASEFEDLTGGGDWEVQIRKDVWFASASFPLIFRFARDNEPVVYVNAHGQIIPPTISEYYRGSHVICHRYYSRFSCDGYGRYESIPWTR
jgi:hypothetical protein